MEFWKNIEEYNNQQKKPGLDNEQDRFSWIDLLNKSTGKSNRRDFLKIFGFGVSTAVLLSACERPVKKAIPYLTRPEEIIPGKASYYASSFFDGSQYCSILFKVRDGRPIKIEGNKLSPITRGGTNAIVQASLLNLYDNTRYKEPSYKKGKTSWETVDRKIPAILNEATRAGKKKILLSPTIMSPSTKQLIRAFSQKFGVEHIMYDEVSYSGMREANRICFGKSLIPDYRFDKARVIISFGADFLGTWLSPVEFAKQYSSRRIPEKMGKNMSFHMQVESSLSVTGSNADKRTVIQPSEEKYVLSLIYRYLSQNTTGPDKFKGIRIKKLGDLLLKNKGQSLVISGSNDPEVQTLVNGINHELENYGSTIDLNNPVYLRQGDDKAIMELVKSMSEGQVDALILYDTNPVYSLPNAEAFKAGMAQVNNKIALATELNETAELCDYILPDNHFAESWNDYQPKENHYSLAQPAINNIFNTRQAQSSLLKWTGNNPDYRAYIQSFWRENVFKKDDEYFDFRYFWNKRLQDGVFHVPNTASKPPLSIRNGLIQKILSNTRKPEGDQIELHAYENVAVGSGKYANNPWLQELPDPISHVCWDNYAAISPLLSKEQQIETGDVIRINGEVEIPVLVQPGQSKHTISVAIGYGRQKAGKVGKNLGVNIYPVLPFSENHRLYYRSGIALVKTGKKYGLANTQLHNSMEERDIVRSMKLEEFLHHPADKKTHKEEHTAKHVSLYDKPKFKSHHWGMVVDLNACIGCNACNVACSVENNIPVVGREEVKQAHEMHWIRIDRYYAGDPENPEVLRQPLMCGHCDNTPCENVCPVQATTHSSEGINQMAYNRCIGTRYCNNNCPYKVRRFNWHDYNKADAMPDNLKDPAGMTLDLPRMILNPDVTVRAKGVIEKCNFCIQRIQAGKLKAKSEGRKLQDDDIQTACQQACPADAIIFGDMNDPDSKISQVLKSNRKYHLQEHLHTLPSVTYMNQVKNELI